MNAEVVDPNAKKQLSASEVPHATKSPGAVGVGIIGTGVISVQYLTNLVQFADVDVRFLADREPERAREKAEMFGLRGAEGEVLAGTVDELLAREDIEIVINLTTPDSHVEIGLRALEAGKHVWSEKPVAMDADGAQQLLRSAEEKGLRVACAPDTMLGGGIETALRAIADGRIGDVLTARTVFQTPGPESWHPSPEFLFAQGAGPLFDMGPYYTTTLVRALGPVARVAAVSSTAFPTRTIGSGPKAGTEFPVEVPTLHAAILQFASGAVAQMLFSFESAREEVGFVEISGTTGALVLPDPNMFEGDTRLYSLDPEKGGEPETLPAVGSFFERGTGVVDLARSIRAGQPEQASGALAAHVLDVLLAIRDAAAGGEFVDVSSRPEIPAPLGEDFDPSAPTL